MEIDNKKFNKIKKFAEEFYKTVEQIYCPYFKETINFNVRGLNHIKMKSWNKARAQKDQYMRFKLIHLAPEIIRASHTLQGYSKTKEFIRKKINNRWEKILIDVNYYDFMAIIRDVRLRIIIKEISGGQKFFWSIIPFWRMNKKRTKRLLYDGDPDRD